MIGVFSGNLSLDVSEGSKWKISRGGFCGMRSKKVNYISKILKNLKSRIGIEHGIFIFLFELILTVIMWHL